MYLSERLYLLKQHTTHNGDTTMKTEAQLIEQHQAWCVANNLPFASADDLLGREDLTNDQFHELLDFIEEWEEVMNS